MRWLDSGDADHSITPYVRTDASSAVVCVVNWTPVPRPGYRVGLPVAGEWTIVLNTDAARFGGVDAGANEGVVLRAEEHPWQGCAFSAVIDLAGMSTLWCAPAVETR